MTKLLVYGTLRRFHHNHKALGLDESLEFISDVRLRGYSLYNLGWFPGVIPNLSGSVACELYRVTNHDIFRYIDQYEGFDPRSLKDSMFVRKNVTLDDGTEAQIYVYNGSVDPTDEVLTGDWKDVS